MSARMIDPSARIEVGATIGKDVSIGPYCTIGAHVKVSDGCRLVAGRRGGLREVDGGAVRRR